MRKGLDDLDPPLDQDIGPTAIIARDPADQYAKGEADGDTEEPDRQRDPRTVDHSRQQIATQPIGAEQKQLPAARRAGEVQVARDQPPEQIFIAATEEADRLTFLRVRRVDALKVGHVEPIIVAINKRDDQPTIVKDPDALRGREYEVSI